METTTIQISRELQKKLEERKIVANESYEEVIADLIEDTLELSEETKRNIVLAEKDIKEGKMFNLDQIKREFNLHWEHMVYELNFTDTFRKQFSKLEKSLQQRIISGLERIRIRPEHFVTRLVDSPYYKLRIGDYRVILDVRKEKLIIFLIEVGHRKNIYKG